MCGVPMDATFHGGSNDTFGGHLAAEDITDLSRFAERTDLCRQYSLLVVSLTLVNSLLAVSWTPTNNLSAVLLTPTITFFPGFVDTGQK
jgi:hypothetical protein